MRRVMSAVIAALAALIAIAGALLLTGQNAIVVTHGVSMNPVYYQGDMVVVARMPSYHVGQIVAYEMQGRNFVVLHRIIGGNADGFVFKGDNNQSTDPTRPTQKDLLGRAVLHIPAGGLWLQRIASPTALSTYAFLLLAGGGTAVERRRRRRRHTMSGKAQHGGVTSCLATLSPALRAAAAAAAIIGVGAVALAALAWTARGVQSTTTQQSSPRQMTFAYSAQVPRTAAYDGTTASSPDPIFRNLANTVEVRYTYRGPPGTISMTALLSTAGGWHSSVPLTAATPVDGTQYDGSVQLNLSALGARAQAAAAVTGLPQSQVLLTLAPTVTPTTGKAFEPTLALDLTPLQLALAGGPSTLTVTDSTKSSSTVLTPPAVSLMGHQLAVSNARPLSLWLLALSLLIAVDVALMARQARRLEEGAVIRRRYGSLLVVVQPISASPGRPLVDVTEMKTLAKLAERYGLLILCWTRSGVETFVVQDENTTYRYRTGTAASFPVAHVATDA
jgi:signal peptidase I